MIRYKRSRFVFVLMGILTLALVAMPVLTASAADTGFFNANLTVASASVSSPNNGWTSNNQYATFNSPTDTAEYGFADLGIPAGATIDGIEVTVEGQRIGTPQSRNLTAALWNTSDLNPDAYTTSQTAVLASSDITVTLGGPTDKWGTTWTVADFADATFKIRVGATSGTGDADLDAIRVKVYYRVDTTTSISCTSPVTYGSSSSCMATVTRSGSANTPSGNVTWATTDSGTFGTSTCTNPTAATLQCTASYTPSSVDDGTHQVTATYAGDTNFTGSTGSQNVTVNQKALIPGITVSNKVYDGTTAATVTSRTLTGIVVGDSVSLTGGTATFDDQNVGAGKAVTGTGFTLSGAQASNYTLSPTTANTTADILAKDLTVTGITADNKVYDGATAATLSGTPSLVGVVGGDTVNLGGTPVANFADANVGVGKTVTVSGYTIDNSNYTLTQPTLTADITAKGLTVSGAVANDKVYDGNTTATVDFTGATLVGVVGTDDVSLDSTGYVASFADANVGTNKAVTVLGVALSGTAAENYTVSQPSGLTASILAKTLTVTGAVANDKPYDGTNTATVDFTGATLVGVVSTDDVSLNASGYSASFADANVGTGKPVTVVGVALAGADAGNYSVAQPSGLTANITPADTITSLASSLNPSVVGASVTFTATVAPSSVTGDVQFYADGAALGSPATLSGGVASVDTASLIVGTHIITATYSGDGNHNASTSATLSQIVEATLTINVVGSGSVTKDPNQTTYPSGTVVTVTAVPAPGWSFGAWTGDLVGSTNPATITIDGNKVVTATFTQDEYTLTVNTVGSGIVAKNPNQPTYHYGDVITLTATPDAGWSFGAWTGDLTGSANPATITIDSNKVVTATFTQDEYTLTVNTVGSGGVTRNPNQPIYHYGDVVTLTAVPAANWVFANWSGDLTGTVNPAPFTISGNNVVTATFLSTCQPVSGTSFNYLPTAPRVGQPVNFTATVISGTAPITFTWNFGHGANVVTTAAAIVHSFPLTTTVQTYNVTLTAANSCGSAAAAPASVMVWPYMIFLPLISR